jgi:hypothetical protein
MLVVLVAAAEILAVTASTFFHLARLPCQPTSLVSLPALFCVCFVLVIVYFCHLICLEQSTFLDIYVLAISQAII